MVIHWACSVAYTFDTKFSKQTIISQLSFAGGQRNRFKGEPQGKNTIDSWLQTAQSESVF